MKKAICILLAALMLGTIIFAAVGAVRAGADVGNFNDYGDGGGGYDGGYDYDYDTGGDGDPGFLFGWLFSSSVGPYAAIPIVLLVIFLVIRGNKKRGRHGPAVRMPGQQQCRRSGGPRSGRYGIFNGRLPVRGGNGIRQAAIRMDGDGLGVHPPV